MQVIESILILVALASLWPYIVGYRETWYTVWLLAVVGLMVWVTTRRLARIRSAADEAKEKHDEAQRLRGPSKPEL